MLLAGDLYHYPEERTTGRIPTFEFDVEQSKASRAKIEAFIKHIERQVQLTAESVFENPTEALEDAGS